MRISVLDASNYFRAMLLLIRKDRKITESEIQLLKRIGSRLGFEREFCDNAIQEILENKFIVDAPPVFAAEDLAMRFIKDGFTIAFADADVHPSEEEWLRLTAEKNGLSETWFHQERKNATIRKPFPAHLEVDDLTVEYS